MTALPENENASPVDVAEFLKGRDWSEAVIMISGFTSSRENIELLETLLKFEVENDSRVQVQQFLTVKIALAKLGISQIKREGFTTA